ncbi:MAG: hypothetical protein FWG83_00775 [Oscillospiraceae bacterium]|nr:hypothetical protein [Oscillospiraceae bacterium]
MANTPEIRDTKKTCLSVLVALKRTGGTIDDAISQMKASMERADALEVFESFKEDDGLLVKPK